MKARRPSGLTQVDESKVTPRRDSAGAAEDDDDDLEEINPPQVLMGTTWKLFKVSPMYKFETGKAALQKYGQLLTAYMQAQQDTGTGVAVGRSASAGAAGERARFSELDDVAISEEDPEAIEITCGGLDARGTPRLRAILCSVGATEVPPKGFTRLPLLLVKGAAAHTDALSAWLGFKFDCTVTPMHLQPVDLIWIATEWAAPPLEAPAKQQRALELLYTPPATATGMSKITYTVQPSAIRGLQQAILEESGATTAITEGTGFVEALEAHFFDQFSVKLAAMTLSRVGTYAAICGAEGRLKLMPLDGALKEDSLLVLQFLTLLTARE